jgi:hypothetical protein
MFPFPRNEEVAVIIVSAIDRQKVCGIITRGFLRVRENGNGTVAR